MAKQVIGIGVAANDGTGDPLRTAFDKANDNFTELYDGKATAAQGALADTAIQAASGIGIVLHGAAAGTARPSYAVVHWYGTVEPTNGTDNDLWFDTP